MDWEIVAQDAAKSVLAQAGGVVVAGAEGVVRVVLRRLGVLPSDPKALLEAIVRAGERDPQFAAEVAEQLAVVAGQVPPQTVLPPRMFFDRVSARARLARPGTYLIAGAYGVGKTALALQVCQDVATEFPGGVAYVDLDGFRAGEALQVTEVQQAVLRQLGAWDGDAVPAELAGQYLLALARRRFVLVLENTVGVAELKELVQPWPASLVLVTTRRLTDDLWAWAPSGPVILHGLDEAGARDMLEYSCPAATSAEPEATAELLDLCDRMPYAIQQAAALLGRRRGAAGAVAAVRDELASSDNPGEVVSRCLSLSLKTVSPSAVDDLVGLAGLPVVDLSHEATEAALGRHPKDLVDAALVIADHGRIRLPRLVRDHALRLPNAGTADGDLVFRRLLVFHRDRAVAADLAGGDRLRCYPVPQGLTWPRSWPAPLDWLEAEAWAIAAVVPRAFHTGQHVEVIQLCGALEPLLTSRGHHGLIAGVNEWGLLAAHAAGDPLALSRIHGMQGRIMTLLNLLERAAAALAEAERVLASVAGVDTADRHLARAWSSLLEFRGSLAAAAGDLAAAAELFRRCLAIDERHGLPRGAGLHHRMLADVLVQLGEPSSALDHLARAAALTADDRNASRIRTVAARAYLALDDVASAHAEVSQARRLAEAAGARRYEVEFADLEAEIALRRGDTETARRRWGWIAQGYWNAGDRRFDDYLAKLSRLPQPPR